METPGGTLRGILVFLIFYFSFQCFDMNGSAHPVGNCLIEQNSQFHLRLFGTYNAYPDGEIPRHCLRLRLAEFFHRVVDR